MQAYTAIVVALVLGGLGGYLLRGSSTPTESSSVASTSTPSLPPPAFTGSSQQPAPNPEVSALQQRLDANPKDVAALIELGNISFDASRWPDAIGYYTRALNQTPGNPDVRTNMGIAYYYSGDADRALKEFAQALKDDPRHAQTLFNVGIVKMNGKNDPKGAIAAWESLLKIDPMYKDRAKVETMLTEARAKVK